MSEESELFALIDLIHEALLDGSLWPSVLVRLADATGAAQISMSSREPQTGMFTALAPRTDPDFVASYTEYWRHHNPLLPATFRWPAGKIYALDQLMPREAFAATPVCNEWWLPSGRGLAAAGANIMVEDQFSALIYIANGPGEVNLGERQISMFKAALRHITWAVRINRRLWDLELEHLAPAEQFEALRHGALLLDASARVVRANGAAKAMLDDGDGIVLRNGRLFASDGSDELQELVSLCARRYGAPGSPGYELRLPRIPPDSQLHVTVTPLGLPTRLAASPWLGVGVPVAFVTMSDPDAVARRRHSELCQRYNLTGKEAALATEILKGDGRAAAARRCNISEMTAKTYLANIFAKTGTRRQAELVRLLIEDDTSRNAGSGHTLTSAARLAGKDWPAAK